MPIQLLDGFLLQTNKPLDYRIIASNSTDRINMPNKYNGMKVFQLDNRIEYIYNTSGGGGWSASSIPTNALTGTGVTNSIPYYNTHNTLTASFIYITGSNVGIRQINPRTALEIAPLIATSSSPMGVYTHSSLYIDNIDRGVISHGYYYNSSLVRVSTTPISTGLEFNKTGSFGIVKGISSSYTTPFWVSKEGYVGIMSAANDVDNPRAGLFNIGSGTFDGTFSFYDRPFIYMRPKVGTDTNWEPYILMESSQINPYLYSFGINSSGDFNFTKSVSGSETDTGFIFRFNQQKHLMNSPTSSNISVRIKSDSVIFYNNVEVQYSASGTFRIKAKDRDLTDTGTGRSLTLNAGNGTPRGGDITIVAGNGTNVGNKGGDVYINPGTGSVDGSVYLVSNGDGNVSFFGATGFSTSKNVIGIKNATVEPTGTPTGGGFLYMFGGSLKFKDYNGNISTIVALAPYIPPS